VQSKDYPDLPFVQARGDGGPRATTRVIIIHATDNATANADQEAAYAARRSDETSAHYYVDANKIVQALPIGNIAWGALWHGNQISIQYELCGQSNRLTDAVIRRAATQVARDTLRYNIPIRRLSGAQVAAGERGIVGHDGITVAFPQDGGNHTDPGASFPWDRFIAMVKAAANPTPVPPIPPTPSAKTVTVAAWPKTPSTMWQVAEAAYGAGQGKRWQEIWYAPVNATVRASAGNDPGRIKAGWVITIP
jgi:N-acetyl-anhydromuramyl-L-alanine amidase AmpD